MAIFFDPLAQEPTEPTGLLGGVQFDRSASVPALSAGSAVQFNRGPSGQVGMFDPASLTVGLPEGFTTRDNGAGTYEILDSAGQVVGTGYDDLNTTLLEMQKANLLGSIQEQRDMPGWFNNWGQNGADGDYQPFDPERVPPYMREIYEKQMAAAQVYYTSPYFTEQVRRYGNGEGSYDSGIYDWQEGEEYRDVPRRFNTREELEAELAKFYATPEMLDQVYGPSDWSAIDPNTHWEQSGIYGDAAKWEALGIMLADKEQGYADRSPEDRGNKIADMLRELNKGPSPKEALVYKPFHLGGSDKGRVGVSQQLFGLPGTGRLNSPGTERVEEIVGAHALYNSEPVFQDGKVIGYQMDLNLLTPEQIKYFEDRQQILDDRGGKYTTTLKAGPTGASHTWERRSSATATALGREYNEGWEGVATPWSMDDPSKVFIPTDKVDEIPGFKNLADTQYENWAGGGFLEKVLPGLAMSFILGPVGAKIGSALGSSIGGVAASAVGKAAIGGAITGGVSSAIFGGNPLTGMLAGGLGAGVGSFAAGQYLGAQGVNPALMTASPQLTAQAGLVGSLAGNAAGDLVMGRDITDRYSTTSGQLGLARHLFAI